jgi:transcriptional regulator with XRE-family HTH domain
MPTPAIAPPALTLDPALILQGAIEMAAKTGTRTADSIGQRIAQLRRERGLTQVELAERLGVTQPAVSDYENDDTRLPADVAVQIARILGVTTDELLGLKEVPATTAGARNRRLHRRLREIEKLPRRDQQALLRTIEAFIGKGS